MNNLKVKYKHSEETKLKIGLARRGQRHSEASKHKISLARRKPKIGKKCQFCGKRVFINQAKHKKGFGKFCSRACMGKVFSINRTGNKNSMWKGDNVGYGALHEWIKNRITKPSLCTSCKSKKKLELCNISGKYKRIISDWEWLCRKCHMGKDGRMAKLHMPRTEILKCYDCGTIMKSKYSKRCKKCHMGYIHGK